MSLVETRRTCHFCGQTVSAGQFITCANPFCDKSSGQSSNMCLHCISRQQMYFASLGQSVFENIFGEVMKEGWYCLDCICLYDFPVSPLGLCCCSWRRRKLKCPLHVVEECDGLKLHCHTYRRKIKANAIESKDVSMEILALKIKVPTALKNCNVPTQLSRFRLLDISFENVADLVARIPSLMENYPDVSLESLFTMELKPGHNRKTCHWCGKEARPGKSSMNMNIERRYCTNIYCDKVSGNSQLLCGACYQKQYSYFKELNIDIRNVFGDVYAENWWCLDCCINEHQLGSCCCSFRRKNIPCQLHNSENSKGTSRVHCHSYYQKRGTASDNDSGADLNPLILNVKYLHVPLDDSMKQYDFHRRSFNLDSSKNVALFFQNVVSDSLPINESPYGLRIYNSETSNSTSNQIYTQPIAIIEKSLNDDLDSTLIKKRKAQDINVVKDFLELVASKPKIDETNRIPTFQISRFASDSLFALPTLLAQDSTAASFQVTDARIPSLVTEYCRKVTLWCEESLSSDFFKLEQECLRLFSVHVPTRIIAPAISQNQSDPFLKPPLPTLRSSATGESSIFLKGDWIYSIPTIKFGMSEVDSFGINFPENPSIPVPPPLLRKESSDPRFVDLLKSSPVVNIESPLSKEAVFDYAPINNQKESSGNLNVAPLGWGYSVSDIASMINRFSPQVLCLFGKAIASCSFISDNQLITDHSIGLSDNVFIPLTKESQDILDKNLIMALLSTKIECILFNYPYSEKIARMFIDSDANSIIYIICWPGTCSFEARLDLLISFYREINLNVEYSEAFANIITGWDRKFNGDFMSPILLHKNRM